MKLREVLKIRFNHWENLLRIFDNIPSGVREGERGSTKEVKSKKEDYYYLLEYRNISAFC